MKFTLREGHEIRGMRIRLYPSKEDEQILLLLEADMRRAWNWLVKQTEDVIAARAAYAERAALVPARPRSPQYDGLDPEEAKALKLSYREACADWQQRVHDATKSLPECSYRSFKELLEHYGCKHDYQLMMKVIGWYHENDDTDRVKLGAWALQALVKNFFAKSRRRKRFRRSVDAMPLQSRSGVCFEEGGFGDRRGHAFYDCLVKFNGLKIRGRLPGRRPKGRVLEGVSIVREADGWWASIKQEVPVQAPSPAVPGSVIGIDVGLDLIAAMSDGTRVANQRGQRLAETIAARQTLKLPVGRLHLQAARHAKHKIYNDIVKPLALIETIKVEKLQAKIGQMGSRKQSSMRTVVMLLRQRYGDRVREVDPRFTSQDCSQCGHRCKESWSYEHGRIGECPKCEFRCDRDVNAARNIASRPALPLVSGEA